MKPAKSVHPECTRCGEPTPLSVAVSGHQAAVCGPCQLFWFKTRDKVVTTAFERFIARKDA